MREAGACQDVGRVKDNTRASRQRQVANEESILMPRCAPNEASVSRSRACCQKIELIRMEMVSVMC